jgi:hypothetical protein
VAVVDLFCKRSLCGPQWQLTRTHGGVGHRTQTHSFLPQPRSLRRRGRWAVTSGVQSLFKSQTWLERSPKSSLDSFGY